MNPITHVAIRFRGKIYSLPRPNRHHDVLFLIAKETGAQYIDAHLEDQGFLDDEGTYLNRKQGLERAMVNHQIKDESKVRGLLFSEDLW